MRFCAYPLSCIFADATILAICASIFDRIRGMSDERKPVDLDAIREEIRYSMLWKDGDGQKREVRGDWRTIR